MSNYSVQAKADVKDLGLGVCLGSLQDRRVICASSPSAAYTHCEPVRAPELRDGVAATTALVTLRALLQHSKLDEINYGSANWNPFNALIKRGDSVLIKPNWVRESNGSGQGLDCLVTHTSVIEAILTYVLKARPKNVTIGDAPVQGCDFDSLREACQVDEMVERHKSNDCEIDVIDFRRTILPGGKLENRVKENCRPLDRYVLFDLAELSDLEPITSEESQFRVSMYNPDELARTHSKGKHQYLISREAIDADIVINVPKLKTHKKAGVTGALKNIVGLIGNKEYLAHHRKGGSTKGGDAYPGKSRLKELMEAVLDRANRASHPSSKYVLSQLHWLTMAFGKLARLDREVEGSWFGNDTVWRMTLDLQRILYFGRSDGTLSDRKQRKVITITDAIISGEGDGPLSPRPFPLGMMTMGINTAAIEWVHALLMGFDPRLIPLTKHAFDAHRYRLATFTSDEIIIEADGAELGVADFVVKFCRSFRPPKRWVGHCELVSTASE